ncbi:MAG: DNA polymerase III subunit delta [Pelagibacteraceae bacterium TMED201]|nr:DNA polymerase III subunit delta [Pelagibacterales bacterium SAG-MED30]OUW63322.1 MAG: DNA polymerase III subunit delta [Pelagibacteraceae bacterium TMED201]|tara:strand:+ start:405 stop:1400 length:996 start_codon:yes stop_codon:yes gene_type:complete
MIVKYFDLKKEIKKNNNFYLLYGQNSGLIEETINNTLKPNFSKNLYSLDEKEILTNENHFKEGILNKSFFDDDKLIIINRATDKILDTIKEIIEKKIDDLKIILKSEILEKKSKLRNYFEKNKDTIIVPFYEDNYQSLLFLAQKFIKEKKIKISSQNINFIIERSKGNRINLKNELEKIFIYSLEKDSINLEEIVKLTNLAENYNISNLIDQCLAGNKKKTVQILNENNPSFDDNILIVKNFLYKLKRLKKLKENLEINENIEIILSSYKPTIFWKDKEIIKQQLKVWTLKKIRAQIREINELENQIKKNSQISNLTVNNFIFDSLNTINN